MSITTELTTITVYVKMIGAQNKEGVMREWFAFFLGTPQRFLGTLAGIAVITVLVFPGLIRMAAERLVAEIVPLLGPAIVILITLYGIRLMVAGPPRCR